MKLIMQILALKTEIYLDRIGILSASPTSLNHLEKFLDIAEIMEDELTDIVGGDQESDDSCLPWECGHNHNEIMVNNKDISRLGKPIGKSPIVELTEGELTKIVGGDQGDGGNCMPWECGHNHNEIVVNNKDVSRLGKPPIVELTEDELTKIVGGDQEGDEGCLPWECGHNHTETLVNPIEFTPQGVEHSEVNPYQAQLFTIAHLIANHQLARAQQSLNQLLKSLNRSPHADALTYLVFARALAERFSSTLADKANLYLQPYEISQIQLFNLLANQVPLVSLVSQLAIDVLVDACIDQNEVTLIDIGIGTGRQMVALLHQLARQRVRPQRLHMIGIEPVKQSLSLAQQNILNLAHELQIQVDFTSFCKEIEALNGNDWQWLTAWCDRPIINASFALHHICDVDGQDVRTSILRRLRQLNPSLIVLSEPNADHLESDFLTRFSNCWRHYVGIFQVIEALEIDQVSKDGLKAGFFGREVIDVLKVDNTARIERHETAASWVNRLQQSGYRLKTLSIDDSISSPLLTIHNQAAGYLDFNYQDVPLVSLLCAQA
ncbi:MAG: GRAS family protein [Leptolyngbya sp. SIO1D8]|nr:GRAS family protein [Leptolyngbya sp. SIO1D8]